MRTSKLEMGFASRRAADQFRVVVCRHGGIDASTRLRSRRIYGA